MVLKDYFGKDASLLKNKKLFLFDMDGTIYNENTIFDGTLQLLQAINKNNGQYVFITNNSSKAVEDYVKKVTLMGIKVTKDNFFTSSNASVDLMKQTFKDGLIYAQGTASFINELKSGGLNVTTCYDKNAVAILLGYDTELTFEKLNTTSKMLCTTNGAFYATHPDMVCPCEYGYVPDLGSLCVGLTYASKKSPIFIGKPQPTMIFSAMKRFKATCDQTVVIGDRLHTDILSGVNAGVDTILVLSGEATLTDLDKSPYKPTFTFNSVKDILLD